MNKKNFFFIFFSLGLNAFNSDLLVNHVKSSIKLADSGISKLSKDILSMHGMSSPKVRHFLNNICDLSKANYLEIGIWKGSTFISALYENNEALSTCIGMDNWSGFDGPKQEFYNNAKKFLSKNTFNFYNSDCFSIDLPQVFHNSIDIYFYDGGHSEEDQEKAFTYFNSIFSNVFIAIIDDWNYDRVRIGTKKAFEKLKYKIHYEKILSASFNGDKENWWNGLYVAVIEK